MDRAAESWPFFPALLRRHDLTRFDVQLYGALVHHETAGVQATTSGLAAALQTSKSFIRTGIARLRAAGLVRVLPQPRGAERRIGVRRYRVTGPVP